MVSTKDVSAAERLDAMLLDQFSKDVLAGSLRALGDGANPIRLNHFAASFRELITHTLHTLSPDESVKACSWFKQHDGTQGPTRAQRIQYAVQGGLASDYVLEELGVDLDDLRKTLAASVEALHKFTHVRPNSVVSDAGEIERFSQEAIEAMTGFLETARDCRRSIARKMEDKASEEAITIVVTEHLDEVAELANHYSVEAFYYDDVKVTSIDPHWVHYEVTGSVEVGLQWGSNSDIRNDMGALGEDSFPCKVVLRALVDDPEEFISDETEIQVDTSSWFGLGGDDEE